MLEIKGDCQHLEKCIDPFGLCSWQTFELRIAASGMLVKDRGQWWVPLSKGMWKDHEVIRKYKELTIQVH